jgi:hypothetical protein
VSKVGNVGRGSMWVEGPVDVRGTPAYLLHFEFSTRVGPIKAVNRTASWIDPRRLVALRYSKHERHPLTRHDERVELFPAERRWTSADGGAGESLSDAPLDELSFLYFLRTLPIDADTVLELDRHFEAGRNPVRVTVHGGRRDTISTRAGRFATVAVEMRVKDARRYHGEGVITVHLSDDTRRLPVRIESSVPVLGAAVLTLESVVRREIPDVARRPLPDDDRGMRPTPDPSPKP